MAWPLALNGLLTQSMMIIDTLLVSPLGEVPVAALGIATTIVAFFLGLQFAIGNGTQLIIGRIAGASDQAGLHRELRHGALISMVAALLFFLTVTVFGGDVVDALVADQQVRVDAKAYLAIARNLFLANAAGQTLTVFLNGQGDTKTTFKIYLLEVPLNIVLSYLLIFGVDQFAFEGLGVAGAATGSLIAVVFRLLMLLQHVGKLPVMRDFRLSGKYPANEVSAHFHEVLPVASNFVVLSVGYTVYQLLFSQLDIYSFVAITLIFPWLRIATQAIVSWAQANSISITQAIGRGDHAHLKVIVSSCIRLGMMMALAVSAALYMLSLLVPSIYTNVESQTLAAMATIMPVYVLLPLVRTHNTIAGNSLRAMGYSVEVLKIHFICQWIICLPLCSLAVLYFELSLFWVFAILPFEEIVKAIPFHAKLTRFVAKEGQS